MGECAQEPACPLTNLHLAPVDALRVCARIAWVLRVVVVAIVLYERSKKECPTCRAKCQSQRNLRPDKSFDKIIQALYPDLEAYEQTEQSVIDEVCSPCVRERACANVRDPFNHPFLGWVRVSTLHGHLWLLVSSRPRLDSRQYWSCSRPSIAWPLG